LIFYICTGTRTPSFVSQERNFGRASRSNKRAVSAIASAKAEGGAQTEVSDGEPRVEGESHPRHNLKRYEF